MTDDEFAWFLDEISMCFIDDEFGRWKARFILPFSMITRDGPVVLRTSSALREHFDHYLVAIKAMGLDKIYRVPRGLEDCHDGTWIGTHTTYLMCGAIPATEPYTSSALLEHRASGPKMRSVLNARGHQEWTGVHPT